MKYKICNQPIQQIQNKQTQNNCTTNCNKSQIHDATKIIDISKNYDEVVVHPLSENDPIRKYDYHKYYDPFEQPSRRVARHDIPPHLLKRQIDIPTRGYPDNFTQVGILIKVNKTYVDNDNKIIRLFGRQEFPGSYRYEYYTMVNSGYDKIKIPIKNLRQKELYDDDIIFIKELDNNYKIQLHNYDAPKYYPDIIY
jgi:hypothetical protein